ncbi:MAG: PP2C family protein-serine/threonine phosphatase [Chitinophagales bacterium]|nr:PP2C family protein-serine/threonine phosphatase [Chitinophagales bacterium]
MTYPFYHHLWSIISEMGLQGDQHPSIRKKIVLANQLSFLMLVFILISALIFAANYGNSSLVVMITAIGFIPAFTLLLNRFHYTDWGRFLLGIAMPIIILMVIVGLKMFSTQTNFKVSEYQFYTPRYYIMALSLLPLILIDLREKAMFVTALVVNVVCLTMFDFAHDVCGVGHQAFGFQFYQYYQATIMPVVLLFFLYFSIVFYQRENQKHENKIQSLLDTIKIHNEEINREIQMAKNVVERLLPQQLPSIKGLQLASYLQWSKEVGGDYYTVRKIDDERHLILIADVAGKGLAASFIVSNIHSFIETQLPLGDFNLKGFIGKLNEVLCKIAEDKFVTCWAGVYHSSTHVLESINAGHPAPLLLKGNIGQVKELKTGGTLLGFFEDFQFKSETTYLQEDDVVVLYTDGITEAANADGKLYDEGGRLATVLQEYCQLQPEAMIAQLRNDVYHFAQTDHYEDDFTCLVIKCCVPNQIAVQPPSTTKLAPVI